MRGRGDDRAIMRMLVLGAGVIGVTSAYYLALAGHDVTVVDRQAAPALETSFANAGEISPGYSSPWAAPGIPLKAIRWLLMRDGPLVIRPLLDAAMWKWGVQLLGNCTASAYVANKSRMLRVATYSRDKLGELRSATGITYDERQRGTLQLFRSNRQLDHAADDIAVLERFGVPYERLGRGGCIAAEPGLAASGVRIAGGLRLPEDETGDCKMFADRLATIAAGMGVVFRFNTRIRGIEREGDLVTGVATSAGTLKADAFLLALGSYSPLLVRPLGLDLPIYPIKGYSLTVPIVDAAAAPVSTVMDETFKVATTRLGDRIRVGGTAEIAGYDTTLTASRRAPLERSLRDLFPMAGDVGKATFWAGLRPMTPDGTPILGRARRYPNLFLNTGHGTLGWTMAAGAGKILSDMISGRQPEIETADLGLARYER